jgi:phosphatidylglycerophosphate synthase
MAANWVLVLEPPNGDAARKLGGLSLALRLALDAQAAGASALVADASLRPLLEDSRLRIPPLDRPPEGARAVRVGASTLVHRALYKAVLARDDRPEIALGEEKAPAELAYGFDPIAVTDDASARRAETLLFRSLRKLADGWTSRWLNRHISLAISRHLVKTPLTPNQVSIAILGVGVAGAVLASRGDYAAMAAGATLFQAQSVLDGCDGEMSRVTHRGSLRGEWLDTIGDDLTNYGFFGGAAWGLYASTGTKLYLLAGVVTVLSGLVASAIEYRYLARIGSGDLLKYPIGGGASTGGFFSAIQPLFKRDTFVFLTFLAALAGALGPMLLLFSLGAVGIVSGVFAAELRMAREGRDKAERRVEP